VTLAKPAKRPRHFSPAAEFVDNVVDVVDAFEAKRKRQPKMTFEVEE
jgi:hypothetical protein